MLSLDARPNSPRIQIMENVWESVQRTDILTMRKHRIMKLHVVVGYFTE